VKLLLIESPGKLKKLKQILGAEWNIKATMGHVVELASDGDDSLGFTLDPQNNRIDCRYIPRGTRGKQVLKDLREAVKQASEVYLATDPDREGETIGWHLAQQLRLKNPQRVVYTEITEKAVRQAIAHCRPLDLNLVAAGRCRDTLDKLVGYRGSPLLWRLGNGAKSMGRVQSATLHILCQREREIQAFTPQDYWSVFVDYAEGFRAYYAGLAVSPEEKEYVQSDDAAELQKKQVESVRVLSQQQADQLVNLARTHPHKVVSVEAKTENRKPPSPFTTSSLQQAAGSRLKYGSEKTMKLAQTLYEQGYITYMRTDSVALSDDYCQEARQWLQHNDPQNIPERVATQKSKAGAQEAHEAIRPTHVENIPDSLSGKLGEEEAKLYSLIWGRSLASQCKSAELQKTRIVSQSGTVFWQARGQVVAFKGYTVYWNDISSDNQLPIVQQGQQLTLKQAGSEKKQTQPPPRYTEPKLVQVMERKAIGRPSTYAPTCKILREREYVSLSKGYLQPTKLGMEVDEFLERTLPDLIKSEFTAGMEAELDAIASGKQNWERYLIDWNETYFAPALEEGYRAIGQKPGKTSTSGSNRQVTLTEIRCPKCEWMMQKISCNSKKLEADHFLKCSNQECDTVMFWSDKNQGYELPYSKQGDRVVNSKTPGATAATPVKTASSRQLPIAQSDTSRQTATSTSTSTDYPCPVCGQPLELYEYVKDGQQKQMLRCSDAQGRQRDDHKKVVYFASKGVFWSPTYGEVGNSGTSTTASTSSLEKPQPRDIQIKISPVSSHKTLSKKAPDTTAKPQATRECLCPVCNCPLELYEYIKASEKKQMLRCSDAQARRQEDHKDAVFFASRGLFRSVKYGEIKLT